MTPIDLIGRERRLMIHLKRECLMDMILGGDRQGHGLGKDIGLPQAEHNAFAEWPRQLCRSILRKAELAERGFLAVAPEINPDAINLARQGPHRLDHKRVFAHRPKPVPARGKKIPKLSDPPGEDVTKHATRPIYRFPGSASGATTLNRYSPDSPLIRHAPASSGRSSKAVAQSPASVPRGSRDRRGPEGRRTLSVLSVFIFATTLAANLARPERCRVNIGISRIRGDRVHERVEVTGRNVLPRDRLDVGGFERACHGTAILRTGLWGWPGKSGGQRQIRAEVHEDAAGIACLTEMDMSLRHRARERWRHAHVRIGQRVVDRAGLFSTGLFSKCETYRTRAVGQDRPGLVIQSTEFLEPVQARREFLRISVAGPKGKDASGDDSLNQLTSRH